jgi:Sulfotransferase family
VPLRLDQAEDALRGKQLVFLVGAGRSGTTWLQLMLSRSPLIVTAQETHLFNDFLRSMLERWRNPGPHRVGVQEVLSDEELLSLLRSVSGIVFAKIAKGKPSATIVLDKSPPHVHCFREILDLWPDAHFIHLIRDPRSVVASMRIASKSWMPEWGSLLADCEGWVSAVKDGRQIRSATRNYQEVTFEELISDAPLTVARLFRGLGLETSDAECQRYVDDCNIRNLQAGRLDNAPFPITNEDESYRRGETDSWRFELSRWQIALIERLAGPWMSQLGYAPISGSASSALAALCCAGRPAVRATKRRLKRSLDRHPLIRHMLGR